MSIAVPNLPASDLGVAKQFYVDLLGFKVVFESTEDGHSGIIGLERDGMRINIDSPMEGHGRKACVSLEVDDTESLWLKWSSVVDSIEPPIRQPWGGTTFELQDPDENTIFVMSSIFDLP